MLHGKEVTSSARSKAHTSLEIAVDKSGQMFQCPKRARQYYAKKSLVNHCCEKHCWPYSKGREVGRRETRGSQLDIFPLPRDPDNSGPRLKGVKGSDLISLMLLTLKVLMTIYVRLCSFLLPTNWRGHRTNKCKSNKNLHN